MRKDGHKSEIVEDFRAVKNLNHLKNAIISVEKPK
jgi:hypothetical protein